MLTKYILGGSALALLAVVAVWQIQVSSMRANAANAATAARLSYSDLKTEYDAYKLQVEQGISDSARNSAQAALAALDKQRALEAENDRLRSQTAAATRQRNEASQRLLDALKTAPQNDDNRLAGSVRQYLDGVRALQAARAGDNPPPARGQN